MNVTRQKLKEMYLSGTNKELAKKLGISIPTLLRLLEDNNIELKGKGFGSKKKVNVT